MRQNEYIATGNPERVSHVPSSPGSCRPRGLILAIVAFLAGVATNHAAVPYASATVTRIENKVSYGQVRDGQSATRPAVAQDVVKASDFLLSSTDSRAELKYEDGTIVRIGQNTVFSFDANNRTLKLDKGTFVFYIPKGLGGSTIKTPSMTAAITGTIGKVSENTIAIMEGEVTLVPGGEKIGKFQFARRNADGTLTIGFFDPDKANDGRLMTFNGRFPGLSEVLAREEITLPPPTLDDTISRTQNLPSSVTTFNSPIVFSKTCSPGRRSFFIRNE